MDDTEVLTATLNNTIQRHARTVQNYEIEIANLTAELVRVKAALDAASETTKSGTKSKADLSTS